MKPHLSTHSMKVRPIDDINIISTLVKQFFGSAGKLRLLKCLSTSGTVVGIVDKLGNKVSTWQAGQMVAALPIVGGYAEYMTLSSNELVPVPPGLDHAEVVSLVLNYITAYQMLHRCAHIKSGESILINGGAAGGVGTALLQLGKLVSLKKMYGTASHERMSSHVCYHLPLYLTGSLYFLQIHF